MRNSVRLLTVFAVARLGSGFPQLLVETPEQLVSRLRNSDGKAARDLVVTCGSVAARDRLQREAATELVLLGERAIPAVEGAIASIAVEGNVSPYAASARWLFDTYAKLGGVPASSKLAVMLSDTHPGSVRLRIPNAVAFGLGLTGYVDSRARPLLDGCRAPEPRNSLETLIFAWESRGPTTA
jgi:hypothetical protein